LAKTRKNLRKQPSAVQPESAFDKAWREMRTPSSPPPTVSGRWLLKALALMLAAAALCTWGALCLLFWQGSWQLLYHPAAAVKHTPASSGLAFESAAFAAAENGQTILAGWWIPAAPEAPFHQLTVLCLHSQNGNLGETVGSLAALHALGVNVFAFDYRGYGESQFAHPSEAHWREDAEWALSYLTGTRHIPAASILLHGDALGANLALEVAASHPELAGVVVRDPIPDPASVIFNDARARLVPARLLVRDRFDLDSPATALRIPSLWLLQTDSPPNMDMVKEDSAFKKVNARKVQVWLPAEPSSRKDETDSITRWLSDLPR